MEFGQYVGIFRKRWAVVLGFAVVGAVAAGLGSSLVTPVYEASTLVFVSVQSSGAVIELAQGSSFTQGQVKSYAEVASTPRVLNEVIGKLDLEVTAAELARSINATAPLDTVNIEIAVQDESPEQAARIANAVTTRFAEVVAEITRPSDGTVSPVAVHVLRPAVVPLKPILPSRTLNTGLGLGVGLAVGIACAILMELLDTRIRRERDVEALTDTPIIGGIALDRDAPRRPLVVQADPLGARAEAFRALRTNLQFLTVDSVVRTYLVASAVPGEGKSTTVANLAITMAQAGTRVVVVDADMRRPRVAEYLGLDGAVGLSDVLVGAAEIEEALQPWGGIGLAVLPAGTRPPNPSELLGTNAMQELLVSLQDMFDVVLIDAPPLLPVADGAILGRLAEGVLMVVAAGRTRKNELIGGLAVLDGVGVRASGVILTMLPKRGPHSTGYSRYAYGRYDYSTPASLAPGFARRAHNVAR